MRAALGRPFARTINVTFLVLGCAPVATRSGEVAGYGPAASAPAGRGSDTEAFQQRIVNTHGNLLSVLQKMALMNAEHQRQISGLMVEMMAEDAGLLGELQPVADTMTGEEREAAALNTWRIVWDIRDVRGIVSGLPPSTTREEFTGTEDLPSMEELGRDLDDVHRRGVAHLREMDLPRLQGMAANVVDLAGNLKRLKEPLGAGFERITPEQRTAIQHRLERMRLLSEQIVQVAGG